MAYFVKERDRAPRVTAAPPVDETLPTACIIGAGSSGIAAAKALSQRGIGFDWFEKGADIGGNWLYNNSNGVSSCYQTLEINTSCHRMAFSDFPMPAHYPPYASHQQVAAYFRDYVDHFAISNKVTFNTEVTNVAPTGDGRWEVTFTTTRDPHGTTPQNPHGTTRTYDAVLVANGHHWDARWPEPPYPGHFNGQQIHSHDYRSGDQLEGKDVVVVGAGNSAMDIAVEASRKSRTTSWSVRRSEWVLRKFLLGRPSDQVAVPGWMPWWVTGARLRVGAVLSGSMTRYGLPTPTHKPGQSHPVQSEHIRQRLAAGAITVRPAIQRLDGDQVIFTDGTSAPANLIVWATGYRVTFPFLSHDLVNPRDNDLPLWWRTIDPDLPGLFFIGLLQPVGAVMPLAEAQAAWVAEILAGDYLPPSDQEIRQQMATAHAENKKQFYASPRHTMEVDFDHYLWSLGRERARGRRRATQRRGRASSQPQPASQRGITRPATTRPATQATDQPEDLRGLVVAVTGAARGIGFEIASHLASAGAAVAIGDLQGAQAAAAKLPTAIGLDLDVRSTQSFESFLRHTRAQLGPIDVLVNNAGVMWVGPYANEPESAMARQIEVNLMGVIRGVKLAAPNMVSRGHGHIITVASAAAHVTPAGEATYAASKHGVLGYLSAVREELRGSGVHLSMVIPAVVDTQLAAGTAGGGARVVSPAEVGSRVLDLVRRPRWEVSLPGYVAPLARVVNTLPLRLRDAVSRRMVPDQVRSTDFSARTSYERAANLTT